MSEYSHYLGESQMLTSLRLTYITREAWTKSFAVWNHELDPADLSILFCSIFEDTRVVSSSASSDDVPGEGHLYCPVPRGKTLLPAVLWNGMTIIRNGVSGTRDLFASSWFTDCCYVLCWGGFSVESLLDSGRRSPASCSLHVSSSVALPHCLIRPFSFWFL